MPWHAFANLTREDGRAMMTLSLAGALMLSVALGGITTLLGFPRHLPARPHFALTISDRERS